MKELVGTKGSDLHIRTWGKGPVPGWTDSWIRVLKSWAQLHRRYHDDTGNDVPWWYKERPNLSVLAGAVWSSGGSALEEYHNVKRQGRKTYAGRADLWVMLDGRGYSIEAKHLELSLNGGVKADPFTSALTEAREDVRKVDENPDHRIGMVFVTPYMPISAEAELESAIVNARAQVLNHRECDYTDMRAVMPTRGLRADLFPRWFSTSSTLFESISEPGKRYYYPGISLFMGFEQD